MYLYELALQLGIRSTDLVDKARSLGMTGVSTSSQLTSEQVQHLRAAIAPPPPPPGAPGLPGAPAGQVPWGPGMAPGAPGIPQPPTAGPKSLSPKMVALCLAAPVVLLAGVFAFLIARDDGDEKTDEAAAVVVGEPSANATEVDEITDPDAFCAAVAAMEADQTAAGEPAGYYESRAMMLEEFPKMAAQLDDIASSATGRLKEDAEAMRAWVLAAVEQIELLPKNVSELSRADLSKLRELSSPSGEVEASAERLGDAAEVACR